MVLNNCLEFITKFAMFMLQVCVCRIVFMVRHSPRSELTANSGANWLKYGAVRTTNAEDGKTSVEFEPTSHNPSVRRVRGRPSLFLALLRTFISYFAYSGIFMLGYSLIGFINPFLLKYV